MQRPPPSLPSLPHCLPACLRRLRAAGGVAGGLAAAITCPFDVVKTRAQLRVGDTHPVFHTVVRIARSEGPRGLFQGWSARAAKAAPACAIVLSAYEFIKHVYGVAG